MRLAYCALTFLTLITIAPFAAAQAPPPEPAPLPPAFYPVQSVDGPRELRYDPGGPFPAGYHRALRWRQGLFIGGAITFGTVYTLTAVVTAGTSDKITFVPLVGPFILAGKVGQRSNDLMVPIAMGFLIVNGLAQAAGAAMMIAGLTTKKRVLQRDDIAMPTVRITPLTMGYGGMGAGIGLVGTM